MSNTRIIPTDRNGKTYYGATTVAALRKTLTEMHADFADRNDPTEDVAGLTAQQTEAVQSVYDAGCTGVANRVAKEYALTLRRK